MRNTCDWIAFDDFRIKNSIGNLNSVTIKKLHNKDIYYIDSNFYKVSFQFSKSY